MSPEEIKGIQDLVNSLKQDVHKELEKLTGQIEKLNEKIDQYNEKSNAISIQIGIIQEKQETLKSSIKNNFKQHEEFYKRLSELEKLPDVSKKAEDNENEIIKIRTTARTINIIFGIIIAVVGALSALGVI